MRRDLIRTPEDMGGAVRAAFLSGATMGFAGGVGLGVNVLFGGLLFAPAEPLTRVIVIAGLIAAPFVFALVLGLLGALLTIPVTALYRWSYDKVTGGAGGPVEFDP